MGKLGGQGGFSYPAVLAFLLVVGILGQSQVASQAMRAKREIDHRVEAEGTAILNALQSYYVAGGETPELPTDIAQLLEDRRNGLRRHLRREPVSPFEGDTWQMIRNAQGQIQGVFLDSKRQPARRITVATTDAMGPRGSKIESFRDWTFTFAPPPN